jgi:hypothetical protein
VLNEGKWKDTMSKPHDLDQGFHSLEFRVPGGSAEKVGCREAEVRLTLSAGASQAVKAPGVSGKYNGAITRVF